MNLIRFALEPRRPRDLWAPDLADFVISVLVGLTIALILA